MVVLDLRMVVAQVFRTCYLLTGTRYAAEYGLCMLSFPRTTPCTLYLVSRPFNMIKLRELGTVHEQRGMETLFRGLQIRRPFRNRWYFFRGR